MSRELLEQLKARDYPVKISFDDQDKVYVAEFFDLPGCSASGDTVEDAYRRAQEAKAEWLRVTLEQGLPIPEPSRTEEYSGRILLRLPTSLHGMLSDKSKLHGVSLNQYILHLLSVAVVGDGVSAQLDELRNKVALLEWRIAQLTLGLKPSGPRQGISGITWTPTLPYCSQYVEAPGFGIENWGGEYLDTFVSVGKSFALAVTDSVLPGSGPVQSVHHSERHVRAK
jgi:antitoxin HicB